MPDGLFNVRFGAPSAAEHIGKSQADVAQAALQLRKAADILAGMMRRGAFTGQDAHLYTVVQAAMAHAGGCLHHADAAARCAAEQLKR